LPSNEDVLKALAGVTDPELGRDIVSLHMVEDVTIEDGNVTFTLNLTTPACPLRSRIEDGARAAVSNISGVGKVNMKVTSNVFATRDYSGSEVLKGVKNIIAVASGKGGVGKSTVAVNLSAALAASGAKVGILDADIYGPNIPHMMGVKGEAEMRDGVIVPVNAFGVKVASLGFFYKDETPLIWRGPLVAGAVRQLLTQVDWGELDYLIVDLPPGCLPAGTNVLMADNTPRPIERVRVGEYVLAFDGEKLVPRRVTGVIPQGKQAVHKVTTPNGTIVASGNHPFLKYSRGHNQWERLDRLKPRDRVVVSNCLPGGQTMNLPIFPYDKNSIEMPSVTTCDFMRVVGHFVGDGFVKNQRGRGMVGIRVCEPRGSQFREEYESLYQKTFRCHTFEDDDGAKFAIASKPLAQLFTALDLNHKAKDKRVPEWVFGLPLDQRLSFIRGYAEADAHIRHRRYTKELPDSRGRVQLVEIIQNTMSVESTNKGLVSQIRELCVMSGIRSSNVGTRIRENHRVPGGRKLERSISHTFQFSLKQDLKPFKLSRIRSIEEAGVMETYDLQVDGLQNFVANSFIVHNTGDSGLTLAQTVPLGGVIIVTTPQEAALNIASKALAMFRRLNVPILGIVENMSYFVCPHCGEKTYIFSSGGGRKAASQLNVDFLGELPLDVSIREQSDLGTPVVVANPESLMASVFKEFAFRVAGMVSIVAYSKMKEE
jgi:Mrp family chromosome partitioning ATPase